MAKKAATKKAGSTRAVPKAGKGGPSAALKKSKPAITGTKSVKVEMIRSSPETCSREKPAGKAKLKVAEAVPATKPAKIAQAPSNKPARKSPVSQIQYQKTARAKVAGTSNSSIDGAGISEAKAVVVDEPLPTTYLSNTELEMFREMLLQKRHELVGDVNNLEDGAIRSSSNSGGGLSSMPIHMADLGSDTWEQELTLGLIENERNLLREIDEALDRIKDRTYGICLATGKAITKARLKAKPWAKYCIEYARQRELGRI